MTTAERDQSIANIRKILSQAGWAGFTQSETERIRPLLKAAEKRDRERYQFVLRDHRIRRIAV